MRARPVGVRPAHAGARRAARGADAYTSQPPLPDACPASGSRSTPTTSRAPRSTRTGPGCGSPTRRRTAWRAARSGSTPRRLTCTSTATPPRCSPRPRRDGDYVVETRCRLDVPAEGCCFNYVQAGLVVYGGDDAFVKLAHASIWETRQTEFAKEVPTAPAGSPRYGNTVVGPPADRTWLRVRQAAAVPGPPATRNGTPPTPARTDALGARRHVDARPGRRRPDRSGVDGRRGVQRRLRLRRGVLARPVRSRCGARA